MGTDLAESGTGMAAEDFQRCYHFEVAYSIPNAVTRSPARGLFEPVERVDGSLFGWCSIARFGLGALRAGAIWVCASWSSTR